MKYIDLISEEDAGKEVKEVYGAVSQKLGMVPDIMKGLANSTAALKAYTTLSDIIENGSFTAKEVQAGLLAVAQVNQCYYCLSAHTAAAKMLGFSEQETIEIRKGTIDDPKLKALTQLLREMTIARGYPAESYVKQFFDAGYTKAHFAELAPIVALKTMSNYFHHMTEIPVDFPKATEIKEERLAE
ncbi:MAG: carboxymuconolactone decarboxylase family protein [Bacteroidales bacterium]|nr:carboxymuconolactone decarboxylase family protein [Bacteroidales bacterium]